MTDSFPIKQGDTSPNIERQLLDGDGNPVDIGGFNEVSFYVVAEDGTVIVTDDTTGDVSVNDAAQGVVEYDWQSGDTDTTGVHDAEFKVEYSDGEVERFPNDGYIDIEVREQLQ